jgi:hypothetical protein
MSATDDDDAGDNDSIDNSIVLLAQRRALHQILEKGLGMIKAGSVSNSFSRAIIMAWKDCSL